MFRKYSDNGDFERLIEILEKSAGEKETVKETAHNILKEFVARRVMAEELEKKN